VLCISPWNFPLAIFTGQISAALVAGNTVIAKPAEQTPLIAAQAVQILWEAGIPQDVLQLLPGRGETIGAQLSADPRIQGIMFTGSTEVAQILQKTVAERINQDRKSTRLNSSHVKISYAVFCLKKKMKHTMYAQLLYT